MSRTSGASNVKTILCPLTCNCLRSCIAFNSSKPSVRKKDFNEISDKNDHPGESSQTKDQLQLPVPSVKMRKAAAPPPPRPFNGTGSGSSSVSAEDSDSMSGESLEGRVELSVSLPGEKVVRMSVERRTPMMDLLVQVTKANNLSPGGFVLKLSSDNNRDPPPYKPSTAIGSLSCNMVYVVPKSSGKESTLPRKESKLGSQPFEKTFRLRVHLPRNQLHVLRVSPNTPLVDVYRAICMDRELTASKYELRHPVHREERLDPQRCLMDYGLSEVAIVAVKEPSSGLCRSSSDIMALQQEEDRKKRGFFGFMFKKNKSSIGDTSSDGHSSRGVSPARSDNSEIQSISPPPSTVDVQLANRRITKKRVAPPPPPPLVKSAPPRPTALPGAIVPVIENGDSTIATTHSRNSSDSSGYHEASILSDSPESANGPDTAESRNRRPLSAQLECKVAAKKGPAPSNLTMVNSTSSLSVLSTGPKKRKAPPVPPTTTLTSVSAPSTLKSSPAPSLSDHSPPPSSQVSVVPKDDDCGNVANSTTSNLNNFHKEHQVIGSGHSRSSSISSRTSSTGEDVQTVVAKVNPPLPVPLPRQTKPPVSVRINETEPSNRNKEFKEVPNSVALDTYDHSSRRTSTSSMVSISSKNDDQLRSPPANQDIKPGIDEIDGDGPPDYSVEDDDGSDRRLSTSSAEPRYSKTSSKLEVTADIDETSTTLKSGANGSTEKVETNVEYNPKSEVSVQTNFDLENIHPVDNGKEHSTESDSSSRNSSFNTRTRSDLNEPQTGHIHSERGGPDLSDLYTEIPEPINASNTPAFDINDFHKQFNLSRHSITSRWGRLVSLPKLEIPENVSDKTGIVESEEEDQESSIEDDEGLLDIDILPPKLDDRTSPSISDVNGFKRSTSVDSNESWTPQQVFEEQILDTNTKLDLETAIEAFAPVDETPTEHFESSINKLDEIENWEYSIPEVPPPPQFDDNTEVNNEPLHLDDSLPEVLCEVPPEFQNSSPELETDDKDLVAHSNIVEEILLVSEDTVVPKETLVNEDLVVHEEKSSVSEDLAVPKDNSSVNEELVVPNELVDKSDELHKHQETPETMADVSQPKQERVEVRTVYRRPIVKFSIATYKARDAEEVSYQNKLSKAESFSIRTSSDASEETKVTKYESSSLPRATTFKDKPNVGSISGQSKAIAEAITAPPLVDVNLKAIEKQIEVQQAKDEVDNVNLRRSKSEMKLDTGSEDILANASQVQSESEQERLQTEYQKLHAQFMQWQQQLMQNQAVLQEQKIAPESTTETLQRVHELQQQFTSLPPVSIQTLDNSNEEKEVIVETKTNSLNRPKSEVLPSAPKSESNTNSLERRPPRIGPKPWRPASVSITAWTPKRSNANDNPSNVIINERLDKANGNSSATIVTSSNPVKDKVTSSNAPLGIFVNRNSTPVAPHLARWPVVKGFVLDPQPKSKVVLNSEKTLPQANIIKPIQSKGVVEVKIASANVANGKPAVATIEIEDKNANKGYVNGSAVNNHINNNASNKNQSMDVGKRFTTVVNLAQKPSPQVVLPPPPPPPPVSFADPPTANGAKKNISFQRSVSSNSSEEGRDELMMAIKDFGGRSGLRKISSNDASWQQRYGNAY